jgi:hypothetical protein
LAIYATQTPPRSLDTATGLFFTVVFVALLGAFGIAGLVLELFDTRRPRIDKIAELSGLQVSFVASVLLAQSLRKYQEHKIGTYLRDARRHADTAFGRDHSTYDGFYTIADGVSDDTPGEFAGTLVGGATRRMLQARMAARSLRRQGWVPYAPAQIDALRTIGWLARDVDYCLRDRQALDELAEVALAMAELQFLAIKDPEGDGLLSTESPIARAASEAVRLARTLPRYEQHDRQAPATVRTRLEAAIKRPRPLWELLAWVAIAFVPTAILTLLANQVWHIGPDANATIIVGTPIVAGSTLMGIRLWRGGGSSSGPASGA